jgi:hypothetical protein
MSHYSKESPEYRGNGHYEINGDEFMSIWTFKNKHGIKSDTTANGDEGKEIASKGSVTHTSTPDFGQFSKIIIYSVKSLEEFYGV